MGILRTLQMLLKYLQRTLFNIFHQQRSIKELKLKFFYKKLQTELEKGAWNINGM